MKRYAFYTLTLLVALAVSAAAQTLRAGAFAGYTTSRDKSATEFNDGGEFFPGATVSAETSTKSRFGFRVSFDASRTPQLPTLFTTDEGEHAPTYELRAHPQIVLNAGKLFFAAGLDTFYQGGFDDDESEAYTRSYGFNPTATVGARTKNHEVSATYIFRDTGTDLYGFRADYFYTLPKGFRVGFQANRLWFRERDREGYIDPYYETDNVFKVSFEVPLFRGGYKH